MKNQPLACKNGPMFCPRLSVKTPYFFRCVRTLAALAVGVTVSQLPAHAHIVLDIDLRDDSAVVFTATGAFSAVDNSTTMTSEGVTLLGFFTQQRGSGEGPFIPSSTLRPSTVSPSDAYKSFILELVNLNLHRWGGTVTQLFSTTAPALTGQFVANLAFVAPELPAIGSSGPVIAGYSGNSGGIIGTWQVVPEPSTYAMALAGLACGGYSIFRRRRTR
jgi:hypothetical protein